MQDSRSRTERRRARRKPSHRKARPRRWVAVVVGLGAVCVGVWAVYVMKFPTSYAQGAGPTGPGSTTAPNTSNTSNTFHTQPANSTSPSTGATAKKKDPKPPKAAGEAPLPAQAMISVPPQNQHPQLPNGCEVTSLSMLFTAIGDPISKMTLAKEMPYDPTPLVKNSSGQIVSWGNPNVGFVGSPYVWSNGFGIYHGPIIKMINKILPGTAVDLTHKPFNDLLSYVAKGIPVEAWVTVPLKPTNEFWVTWQTPEGPFTTTLEEHAVLIVGYDKNNIYVNNPFNGEKEEPVSRSNFIGAWNQLGDQAVTIVPSAGQG